MRSNKKYEAKIPDPPKRKASKQIEVQNVPHRPQLTRQRK